MNKKLRLILCILFILIIGIVTVWRSLTIGNETGQESGKESLKENNSQVDMMEEDKSKKEIIDDKDKVDKDNKQEELTEEVLNCSNMVVSIRCEGGGGNAVFLCEKEDGYVLCTAAHVVSGLKKQTEEQLQIEVEDTLVNVQNIWISDTYDVAFLEIPRNDDFLVGKLTAGLLQDGYTNIKEGDVLYVWSHYNGEVISLEIQVNNPWILIEDFGYHMIWASAIDAKGGMSGSGAFDCDGYLAGILCGGNETEVVVLPMNIILGELKNSSIDISLE